MVELRFNPFFAGQENTAVCPNGKNSKKGDWK
jgi:hypothetical protein